MLVKIYKGEVTMSEVARLYYQTSPCPACLHYLKEGIMQQIKMTINLKTR